MAAISKEGREKKKNEDGGFIYVYHLLAPFLTLLFFCAELDLKLLPTSTTNSQANKDSFFRS